MALPSTVLTAALVLTGLLVGSGPDPAPGWTGVPDPGRVSVRASVRAAPPAVDREVAPEPDRDPTPARGVWPLQPPPEIAALFDPPAERWSPGHRGVDLRGRPGQPVHTALAGTVTYVGTIAGRGVVTVTHGTVRTTYQPVAATVSRGDEVAEGQVVGRLLLAGSHCAPLACLHWGLLRGETYLDPLTLVGAVPQPVRLLPW